MATQYHPRSRPLSEAGARAKTLLDRYPNISEQEIAELVNLHPEIPMLDLGLMTADDQLSEKLATFHKDHGAKLKAPLSSLLLFLAFPTMVAIAALWWIVS